MTNQPIKVLLVEDNKKDVAHIQKMLREAGRDGQLFESEVVSSLAEGSQRLSKGNIDLVLLERQLIGDKEKASFTRFEKQANGIPLIILTSAFAQAQTFETGRNRAQDYLVKRSKDAQLFARTIYDVVDRYRIKKELISLTEELRSAYARLEELSLIDPLTELLNRRGLQRVLSRMIQQNQTGDGDVLALLIDLKNFKSINNTFGHAVGDIVLKEVAQKLSTCLRATDYVGRIGGDEFMILLSKTSSAEGKRVAERIRLAISQTITLSSGESVKITATFGMVAVNSPFPSIDDLQAQAELVSGQTRPSVKLENAAVSKTPEEDAFTDVIDIFRRGDCFYVVKQPIFRLTDRRRVGYEFLSRSTVKGFEMPDDFFRMCLEANILTLVDHHCFKNCVAQSVSFSRRIRCHLNLFPSTMIGIPIQHLIDVLPARHQNYCVEISEQQIIGDPSYLIKPVSALRKAGVQIGIDDVGFGKSCIESLILLEPDVIKIDRRWIHGVARDKSRTLALKKLMKVANSLEVLTIAEGIETAEDLEVLQHVGIKYGQGFYLGKPDLCSE